MPVACVCEGVGLREALREDLDRYVFDIQVARGQLGTNGGMARRLEVALHRGLWAVLAYRLGHYARHKRHSGLLGLLSGVFRQMVVVGTGIDISPDAHIGPGLWMPHGGYIIIGAVRIGRNCNIFQGVTLGNRESTVFVLEPGAEPRVPTLGDRVWVGAGAVVADSITVGDDATIGANSLVTRDVPPRGVMVGVPARLVSRNGSFTQVKYRGMDEDEDRNLALAASRLETAAN